MSDKKKSARRTGARGSNLLSDEERAAMKETLKERRRALSGEADGESDVLAKIAEMSEPDRGMAKRLHAVIRASAPTLSPKTWYGMPAYAKDGKVVCLPERAEVHVEIRDVRFPRRCKPRRRSHLANLLCPEEAQRRRRGKDRQACQESGELRREGEPLVPGSLAWGTARVALCAWEFPDRVTDLSRIRGTRKTKEDTTGHDDGRH